MRTDHAGIGHRDQPGIPQMDERTRQATAVEGYGMTRQIVLLGYPVDHSVSPAFQQAALDHSGLPARYRGRATPPERLRVEVDRLRAEEYMGANVTIPHKERVRSLLDGIDPWARTLGAVNTIVKDGARLVGHNTDTHAFLETLKAQAGFELEDRSVLLIGAGGAARAAGFGISRERVASLTIANRTLDRARSLAEALRPSIPTVDAIPLERDPLAEAAAGADLIVNATSVGMSRGEAEGRSPLDSDLIPSGILVYDMVYTPGETPLMRQARQAGAQALGGLWMLIYQGAASFQLWTGRQAPIEVMYAAGERALATQFPDR